MEDKQFEADMAKAMLNSLKEEGLGESSKEGANIPPQEAEERDNKYDEYIEARSARAAYMVAYNDSLIQLDKPDISPEVREY
jgi:hypothetical protein